MIVTVRPRRAASLGRPRLPTRYPATIVLPWPGESAWRAPQTKAEPSSSRIEQAVVVAARQRAGEAVLRAIGGHRPDVLAVGRGDAAGPRAHREAGLVLVRRALQEVDRIGAQAAGRIAGGNARADVGPLARQDLDRLPADPVRRTCRRAAGPGARRAGSRPRSSPRPGSARARPGPAGRRGSRGRGEPRGTVAPVDREPRGPGAISPQLPLRAAAPARRPSIAPSPFRSKRCDLLEGGDLRLVEDVVDLHRSLRDPHLAQVVDGEVAERVRRGGAGQQPWRSRRRPQARRARRRGRRPRAHRRPSSARCARGP